MNVSLAILLFALAFSVFPQGASDAPIVWTTYNIGDHKLSIDFPKTPIRYDQQDACNEKRTEYFVAYAEEIVYTLTLVKREKANIPLSFCQSSSKFGPETLNERRVELTKDGEKVLASTETELWSLRFGSRNTKIWIFDDFKRSRWVELSVTGRGEFSGNNDFLRSFKFALDAAGVEVGEGSPNTLGDRGVDTSRVAPSFGSSKDKADQTEPLTIISKIKAKYTEAARRNGEQGSVTLKVTFLANGSIGQIQVIRGLKYGLTEQAIAAVRKMVFLPERRNGTAVSTSRPVSFTFNIY